MKYATLLPHSCDGCVHMRPMDNYWLVCFYAYDMDECRRCSPEKCDKYSTDMSILSPLEISMIKKFKRQKWERR